MRGAPLAAGLLIAASCGGSPGSPTGPSSAGPAPTPAAVRLESGPYTLAIGLSTSGAASCQNGICVSTSLCIGSPSRTTASLNVTVERSGETAVVRTSDGPSGLVLNLTVAPAFVTGTISGSARDTQGVAVQTAGTLIGTAAFHPAHTVAGTVDGQIWIGGGSCSNNGHTGSLGPR